MEIAYTSTKDFMLLTSLANFQHRLQLDDLTNMNPRCV